MFQVLVWMPKECILMISFFLLFHVHYTNICNDILHKKEALRTFIFHLPSRTMPLFTKWNSRKALCPSGSLTSPKNLTVCKILCFTMYFATNVVVLQVFKNIWNYLKFFEQIYLLLKLLDIQGDKEKKSLRNFCMCNFGDRRFALLIKTATLNFNIQSS